jgi:signal transduction histidine kinase/response regulator of citrate/malate metabolism
LPSFSNTAPHVSPDRSIARASVWYGVVASLVFLACLLGIELTRDTGRISTIWIANGLLLAIALRAVAGGASHGEIARILAAGLAGNLIANLVVGDPWFIAGGLALSNTLEIVICLATLALLGWTIDFRLPKSAGLFCVVALGPAPLIAGLAAGAVLSTQGESIFEVLSVWYPADALGLLIVTPILMVVEPADLRAALRPREMRGLALVLAVLLTTLAVVFIQSQYPLLFLVFPAILVAVFRMGFLGAAGAIVVTAIVAGAATFNGLGPIQLISGSEQVAVIVFQVFVAAAALQSLVVAAVLAERDKLEADLVKAKVSAEQSEAQIANANARTKKALKRAQQASFAKSEFLASMSHEMRTPLNSIIGFTDIVLEDRTLAPETERRIALVNKAAQSLLNVVSDILDFSKIEAGQMVIDPRPFSPIALADGMMSIVGASADAKKISVGLDSGEDVPKFVQGDDIRIGQILLNLLNNAIKFTKDGTVEVRIERLGSDPGGERLRFSVTDSGIGIPKEKQHLLFKQFSQVDHGDQRRFEGTGLGLAICKRLVSLMGGEIGVESAEGEGSTFWFTLTLPKSDGPAVEKGIDTSARESRALKILLVEDLVMNREVAETMLRRAGHRVETAEDGACAVAAVENKSYDLILMDIQMPGMDGVEATQRIRALGGWCRTVPIIALTANVLPEQVARFLKSGFDDHLGKPIDRKELLTKLAKWGGRDDLAASEPTELAEDETDGDIDPVKLEQLRSLFGEDKILGFLQTVKRLLEEIDPQDRDRKAIAAAAHKLRSSAGMLGLQRISVLAGELEDACDEGREIDGLLADLKVADDKAQAWLSRDRAA